MKSLVERRERVDKNLKTPSISVQCKLLNISRSGLYYEPVPCCALNLELMPLMDEDYLQHPYKGAARMHVYLTKDEDYKVSRNRVERLYYKVMGLRAVFPGAHTSKRCKVDKIYPYLFRVLKIERPNQVWATDITYIPMPTGYLYLVAIIDLYSRFVVNWSLSNTMEAQWCADCFLEAIELHGKPEIMNTDQGSQLTSEIFTQAILGNDVTLSMDGKARATDNAFIESLWKLVKYEDVYLNVYENGVELHNGLAQYFHKYNTQRRHSSIDDQYPVVLYTTAFKPIKEGQKKKETALALN